MSQVWRVGAASVFMMYNLSGVVGKGARKVYHSTSKPSERALVLAVVLFFLIRAHTDARRDHDSIHGERCIDFE